MKNLKLLSLIALVVLPSCSQQTMENLGRSWNRGIDATTRNYRPTAAAYAYQPQQSFVPVQTDFINRQPVLTPYPGYKSSTSAPRSYDIYDSSGTQHLGTLKPTNTGIMPIGGWNR